jgi:hypothetical protein
MPFNPRPLVLLSMLAWVLGLLGHFEAVSHAGAGPTGPCCGKVGDVRAGTKRWDSVEDGPAQPKVWLFLYGSFITLDVLRQQGLVPQRFQGGRLPGDEVTAAP